MRQVGGLFVWAGEATIRWLTWGQREGCGSDEHLSSGSGPVRMAQNDITHIVVLTLEDRSFYNVLGWRAIQANGPTRMPRHGGQGGSEASVPDRIREICGYTGTWNSQDCVVELTLLGTKRVYGPFDDHTKASNPVWFHFQPGAGQNLLALSGTLITGAPTFIKRLSPCFG